MATVPHAVPTRTAHAIAALYDVADDTVIAWQRFCAQTAEALRPQHDPERLSKALALAQGGGVELAENGGAVVTSGTKRYPVQPDGRCECPDFAHRRTPCKHTLAVLIHTRAQALAAPSPSPAPGATAAPVAAPDEDPARWQMTPKTAARWGLENSLCKISVRTLIPPAPCAEGQNPALQSSVEGPDQNVGHKSRSDSGVLSGMARTGQ